MSEHPILLRAGDGSVQFEPESAFIRHLQCGGEELLRAVYMAVRADSWATASNAVENLQIDGNSASWRLVSRDGSRHVIWDCRVSLTHTSLEFIADGTAQNAFTTNRTGLCVLHPSSHAGNTVIVSHPDGTRSRCIFPQHVSPHQPIRDIKTMDVCVNEGWMRIEFEGEIFETEDQRNWSDDSFKTYCRPLDLPMPYRIEAGERIRHAVKVRWSNVLSMVRGGVSFQQGIDMPRLGTMLGLDSLEDWQIERLAALRLGFLGVDLGKDWQVRLREADRVARVLDVPIQPHLLRQSDSELQQALQECRLSEVVIDHNADPDAFRCLGVPLVASSRDNFTELNRQPPDSMKVDGVGFALNPQVHAFDDRSILEAVQTHRLLLEEARKIAMGKPVHVGPVTFEPRGRKTNDPRLQTVLGAAWTLLSWAQLSDAASVTYYQTHGPGGILGDDPAVVSPNEMLFKAIGRSETFKATYGRFSQIESVSLENGVSATLDEDGASLAGPDDVT